MAERWTDAEKRAMARRLKVLALALGMNQNQIAKRLGYTRFRWSDYTRCKTPVTVALALNIKEELGVPTDWVLTGDNRWTPRDLAEKIEAAEKEIPED